MSFEVDGLREAIGVVGGHHLVLAVEQVALAVGLVDVAEHPAVAVEVGELRAGELGVQVRHVVEEVACPTTARERGTLGVGPLDLGHLRGVSFRSLAGYMRLPSVSLSHQVVPRKLLVTVVPG